ncbi:MAG: pre-peptidase C-terminal domain-containing protein [Phycisphaerae bacterium]|jgi:hypothetical protein
MMRMRLAVPMLLLLGVASAWGQAAREPHIGYLYPAGGQRGRTFQVVAGGQFLRGASDVYVTGEGVQATVVRHFPPLQNISREQADALGEKMREVAQKRWAELVDEGVVRDRLGWRRFVQPARGGRRGKEAESSEEPVELPEHPLLCDLDHKSLRELLNIRQVMRQARQGQRNAQIGESVLVEVTIDRDAPPGDRELRIGTRQGLTNPMVFQVGALRETRELEPGEQRVMDLLPAEPPLELPVLINGQIMPGDIDRFRFQATAGQRLVIETSARSLIPYLADAVPGWFQATLALYDAAGNELAFVDDYRFSPDPVLCYDVPADGEYELEIRDSIYRGREDFVYRVALGARPFVTSIFPLGCRVGQQRYVSVAGWNLATDRLFLDGKAAPRSPGIRQKPLGGGKAMSNPVTYDVNDLTADKETESNDTVADAQRVHLPRIVDGRIDRPGDVDLFQFKGKAGGEIVAEVIARRARSPLDSLLRLLDASGNVLDWNDDSEHKEGFLHTDMGVLTHHADSYLRTTLPADGTYYVQVSDVQSQSGEEYAYRLRVSPPQPDFKLRVTPSSLNARAGFSVPMRVYALRQDGFAGEIELELVDAPPGFTLSGARVPAGQDSARVTLSVPPGPPRDPVPLTVVGRATIGGEAVSRPAVPAEDMMQAFLYRHLTPSQELLVAVLRGQRFGLGLGLADEGPVRIPAGGATQVRLSVPRRGGARKVEFELNAPPPGITLREVVDATDGPAFELAADADTAPVGFADNLIVEVFMHVERPAGEGQAARTQRVSLGVLPAIPIEVVPQ